MAQLAHKRSSSGIPTAPPTEDIEGQIDRLNQALQVVMNEIEASNCTRNPSRVSLLNGEIFTEEDFRSPSAYSEENFFPDGFEDKIEELLQVIDRNQMTIEDFRSEEARKVELLAKHREKPVLCDHDINKIRKEIWLEVKMQKNELLERERKCFDEKLKILDALKDEYIKKRAEIMSGIEKLNMKEELLQQKEKELREQKMAFDKYKLLWEQKIGLASETFTNISPPLPLPSPHHPRASSYSISKSFSQSPQKLVAEPAKNESKSKLLPIEVKVDQVSPSKPDQLKFLQSELKHLEETLIKAAVEDKADIEMQIDKVKKKIATLRGEIAINESNKATRIINNMMMSFQKEAGIEEKIHRTELIDQMNKKLSNGGLINFEVPAKSLASEPIKIKKLELRPEPVIEHGKRFFSFDKTAPNLRINGEKDECLKSFYESKRRILIEKEKELNQREHLLQQTWMKIPGSKELIENVNLTLSKLTSEKILFEKEREEFGKEKLEWVRGKEKIIAGKK